jgi:acyl-CoA thioester hydrolase
MNYQHQIRVYWEDTDAGGIVFYANYLKFFERARTEWLRSLGIYQNDLKTRLGAMFVVSETNVKYLSPAVLDDLLLITTQISVRGNSSLTLLQNAYRLDETTTDNYNAHQLPRQGNAQVASLQSTEGLKSLCTGTIRIGWIDVQSGRPQRIPSLIQEKL